MINQFVKVNELNVFYRVFRDNVEVETLNPDLKTMIVLHGGPGLIDHTMELNAWKGFSNILQVIFLDLRGCGRTEGGTVEEWSLKQCGEDLYFFCRALKLHKPILAGVSTGGFVIMDCIIHHPDLAEALILCNTEAKKLPAERKKILERIASPEAVKAAEIFDADPTSIEKSQKFFEACVPYFSKKPVTLMPSIKEDWNIWAKHSLGWATLDYRDGLKKSIQCPTLILAGEDDPNHPLASSTELAYCILEKFRHFEVIANAGAPVYQDQPEAFNQAVSDFLKKINN